MTTATSYDPLPRFVVREDHAELRGILHRFDPDGEITDAFLADLAREQRDPLVRGGQGNAAPAFGSAGFAFGLWLILGVLIGMGLHAAF